jgi:hypothetical protein
MSGLIAHLISVQHNNRALSAAGLGAQAAMRKAAEVFALVWAGSQVRSSQSSRPPGKPDNWPIG